MRQKSWPKLPNSHRFPGGFRVVIRLEAAGLKSSLVLEKGDEGAYQTLTAKLGVITLWKELTPRQQWRTLMHELLHALVDAQNYAERDRRRR